MPKLSIITINLNNKEGLQKTMESVFSQTFTDYEYIIIDGRSTDGSKELIEKYENKLVYWVSEKDGGIFNAMNKGIAVSKGEYLLFLNSGDYLNDPSVLKLVFLTENGSDIIYGNVIWTPKQFHGNYPDKLSFDHFINNTIPHQGSFMKRNLFEKIGKYEEQYSVNSDWNFFVLAIFKYNCSYHHINSIISVCDTGGISLTTEGFEKTSEIRSMFIDKHFKNFFSDYKDFINLKRELQYYKNLMEHRIMKNALRVNEMYQFFSNTLKGK
jgi:glycosyltransferase involved in cell wall biosynthesis